MIWDGKKCRYPSGYKPPAGEKPKKCNEWAQRGGSLPSKVDRLVHYRNCTKRLYCKDGKTHDFKVGQTPNVNACGGGDTTSSGCPKLTDGSLFCDFKFPDSSKISGYPIRADSWTACQRKCWDHGDTCKGWYFKDSSKECTLSTMRDKKDMKYAKGYMGGPRRDVNAGPIGDGDGAPVEDDSLTGDGDAFYDEDADFSNGASGSWQAWFQDNKIKVIAGVLIVLLLCFMSSSGAAVILFM